MEISPCDFILNLDIYIFELYSIFDYFTLEIGVLVTHRGFVIKFVLFRTNEIIRGSLVVIICHGHMLHVGISGRVRCLQVGFFFSILLFVLQREALEA